MNTVSNNLTQSINSDRKGLNKNRSWFAYFPWHYGPFQFSVRKFLQTVHKIWKLVSAVTEDLGICILLDIVEITKKINK